jgi:hypothetical protein
LNGIANDPPVDMQADFVMLAILIAGVPTMHSRETSIMSASCMILVARFFVPQNANDIELCLRLTIGKPALAPWIDYAEAQIGQV